MQNLTLKHFGVGLQTAGVAGRATDFTTASNSGKMGLSQAMCCESGYESVLSRAGRGVSGLFRRGTSLSLSLSLSRSLLGVF